MCLLRRHKVGSQCWGPRSRAEACTVSWGVPLFGLDAQEAVATEGRARERHICPCTSSCKGWIWGLGKNMEHFVSPMIQVALVPHAQCGPGTHEALWPHTSLPWGALGRFLLGVYH